MNLINSLKRNMISYSNLIEPTHQGRHICKAHKADTQKLTLQKNLPCSHASGTHPALVDTDIQIKLPRRRANIQQAVWQYGGATSIFSSFYPLSATVRA